MESKRVIAAAAVAALGITGFTACAPSTEQGGGQSIRFMNLFAGEEQRTIIDDLIVEFEQQNPGITVENVPVPGGQMDGTFRTQLAGGNPPDVFQAGRAIALQLNSDGAITPVDVEAMGYTSQDDVVDAYIPNAIEPYRAADGSYFGVPESFANYLAWVDTQAFSDAGLDVPTTWDEVCEAGPKLLKKDANGQITHVELTLPLASDVQYTFVDGFVRGFGGDLFSGDDLDQPNLTSDEVVEAYSTLQRLVYDCQAAVPTLNTSDSGDDRGAFVNGQAAMMLTGGTWMTGALKEPLVSPRVQAFPWPAGPAGSVSPGYGYGFVVPTASKNQDAAWKFVRFLSDAGVDYMELGQFNGRLDVAESPEAAARVVDWNETWLPSLDSAVMAAPYDSTEIADILSTAMSKILLEKADVRSTLDDAQSAVESALD
ncbi:ABC transporter substrate-binding protein [Herbiconiux sp. A18JL235]|uniref:ABC transporter substrate-binding protein n=1 Tax=Herbiconiux sp. A18JL235 TaxID=3152363 RepID=A0AB39BI25_9MICO